MDGGGSLSINRKTINQDTRLKPGIGEVNHDLNKKNKNNVMQD